ncbi:hypothetical protein JCM17478_00640 [Thermopirellula anaerolimosa]
MIYSGLLMADYAYTLEFFPGITRETIDRFIDDLMAEAESKGIIAGGGYNRKCADLAFSVESPGRSGVETINRIIMAVNDRYHCVRQWKERPVEVES